MLLLTREGAIDARHVMCFTAVWAAPLSRTLHEAPFELFSLENRISRNIQSGKQSVRFPRVSLLSEIQVYVISSVIISYWLKPSRRTQRSEHFVH